MAYTGKETGRVLDEAATLLRARNLSVDCGIVMQGHRLDFEKVERRTLHPTPYTPHPTPHTLQPKPPTFNSQPSTLNTQHSTLNIQPSTLTPHPSRRRSQSATRGGAGCSTRARAASRMRYTTHPTVREIFIDNLLVRVHFIITNPKPSTFNPNRTP